MSSPLERLGDLAAEPADAREFAALTRSGLARLKDAGSGGVSLEGRFDLAYNASHSLSLAALRYRGYRPKNRYVVFQVLPHTLSLGPEVWRVLARAHDLRNKAEYGGEVEIDERLVADVITACKAVAAKLAALAPLR